MSKHVRCSYCGNRRWMRYAVYKKNLDVYKVSNLMDLNNSYLCGKCKKRLKELTHDSEIRDTKEFKHLKELLQNEIDLLIKRGLKDRIAMENFKLNVKSILNKQYINEYDYELYENKLIGIVVKKIPFYGDMLIDLNTKGA